METKFSKFVLQLTLADLEIIAEYVDLQGDYDIGEMQDAAEALLYARGQEEVESILAEGL